jgi:hypothetical protein
MGIHLNYKVGEGEKHTDCNERPWQNKLNVCYLTDASVKTQKNRFITMATDLEEECGEESSLRKFGRALI